MATEQEIAKILSVLAAGYPNFELKKETVQVYVRLLKDMDREALEKAALDHLTKSTFFPAVAQLRDAALQLSSGAWNLPMAEEAWTEIMAKIKEHGQYKYPEFSHPLIDKTMRVFGWREICMTFEDQLPFVRSQFFKTYNAFVTRWRDDERSLEEVKRFSSGVKLLADKLGGRE